MGSLVTYSWEVSDRDGIVTSTTLGAGVRVFTLNGVLVQNSSVFFNNISRKITVYSSGDLSAINFTFTGTDYNGKLISDTIAGPNNSTVSSTKEFWGLMQAAVDADMTAAAEIGSGTSGYTNWFTCNIFQEYPAFTIQSVVNAETINYTLEATLDNIRSIDAGDDSSISVFNPSVDMTAATESKIFSTFNPYFYMRVRINSSDSTGRLTLNILQQGPS